jgi:hypothetical protein
MGLPVMDRSAVAEQIFFLRDGEDQDFARGGDASFDQVHLKKKAHSKIRASWAETERVFEMLRHNEDLMSRLKHSSLR